MIYFKQGTKVPETTSILLGILDDTPYKKIRKDLMQMNFNFNESNYKDTEILMMKNELKKFVLQMQAVGFLKTVDIDEVLDSREYEWLENTSS